jgi:hypothetical protein
VGTKTVLNVFGKQEFLPLPEINQNNGQNDKQFPADK